MDYCPADSKTPRLRSSKSRRRCRLWTARCHRALSSVVCQSRSRTRSPIAAALHRETKFGWVRATQEEAAEAGVESMHTRHHCKSCFESEGVCHLDQLVHTFKQMERRYANAQHCWPCCTYLLHIVKEQEIARPVEVMAVEVKRLYTTKCSTSERRSRQKACAHRIRRVSSSMPHYYSIPQPLHLQGVGRVHESV